MTESVMFYIVEGSKLLKIYFAEDDAAIRESIIRNIDWEKYGYQCVGQAPDGEVAYADMKKLNPDLLITDLKMPFMDGLELSRLVRKEMPEVKIVILTGYGDFESVYEALNLGVVKYLLKPVTPETLVETIAKIREMINQEKEYRLLRGENTVDSTDWRSQTYIEKAQEYIRQNYFDENISLGSVARHVSLSPAHFSTVFSQESGKTFTEYLTTVRIEKAKELLKCSNKRSSEIAFDVGYQDPHYFAYVFKKATGCSPREYRVGANVQ